jgi:hypothetical protein
MRNLYNLKKPYNLKNQNHNVSCHTNEMIVRAQYWVDVSSPLVINFLKHWDKD